MYFFWSRQKNYAVQLLKYPFKRISLKGQFEWKHAPEDHHVVKKAAGRVAKLFTAEKEKLHWQHIFLWHPQFSTMVIHQWWGICGIKIEYVLLKAYQVTGSRLLPTCLANSTGRPGSPCLFFKISETVSNFKQCQTFFMIVGKMLLPDEAEHFSLFILQLDSLLPSLKIICLSCLAFVKDFFEFLKESSPCVSRKAGWTRSIRK